MTAATPFEDLVGSIDATMFVVTAAAGGERSGCLVGFTTQCSIDPPRFLVCLSKLNHTFPIAMAAGTLGVHALRAGDRRLAAHFGEETGDRVDKFAGVATHDGPDGVPVVDGLDWFAGRVVGRFDAGDHVAVVLAPIAGTADRTDEEPLGLADVADLEPGHPA